jgi:hypothetical protein
MDKKIKPHIMIKKYNEFESSSKPKEIKTLEYSMDYSQECEDFTFEISGRDHSDDVTDNQVTEFINSLVDEVKGFYLSLDRTEGTVIWYDNGLMRIDNRTYNSPDWNDFDEVRLKDIPLIDFPKV